MHIYPPPHPPTPPISLELNLASNLELKSFPLFLTTYFGINDLSLERYVSKPNSGTSTQMSRFQIFLPAHLIPFLILFQLLLLRFQGVQTLFNVLQQVVDLLPFALYKQTTFWSLPLFCHMQKPLCIRNNGKDHPPKKIANSSLECSYAWSVSHTHTLACLYGHK